MKERDHPQVYCYRCGKWLDRWHYVYVNGKMLPACPDERNCKPDKYRKGGKDEK